MRTTATDERGSEGIRIGLDVHQNKYLSARRREREIHAIVTVRVEGSGGGGSGDKLAEVLVVDCSSSMSSPQEKFRAAKDAAVAALHMLPDGTPFAVVRGTDTASTAHPEGYGHGGEAVPAAPVAPDTADRIVPRMDAGQRDAAGHAVRAMDAVGGTSIGTWLDLSRRLLAARPTPIGHVLLLTDGQNLHDSVLPLSGVLEACQGRFVCDCWGIGDDWDARELMRVASALHGRADCVDEVADLAAEYRALMGDLLSKTVPEIVLRVAPSPGASVRFVKQVFPTELELTGTPSGAATEYLTRAWGDESRRYHVCLSADPEGAPQGEDLQLAAVSVLLPDGAAGVALPPARACEVHWTDDPALSGAPGPAVGHFADHKRLGEAAGAALDAFRRGDRATATERLGAAVAVAHRLRAERTLDRLRRLVEIDDAARGRVRLRDGSHVVDFQRLITSTGHSTFGPGTSTAEIEAALDADTVATLPCPVCGCPTPVGATYCNDSGHVIARNA
ncbi:vWA domain-containing protein [Streptomyces fuscigenes]|uniref:vWA domain-containing protein n=1 Tax=Streptomyces fuscigenes TaxID=1528880 RepID=UPI001F2C5A0A|nr:vWA domain-containing protein [Streptomyces fuscigenes]MCF3962340.1 VWA domain-containing protein [Streptomyces fuscigenes]